MPPNFRLFFQRKGDDMTSQGIMQYYRWWANPTYHVIAAGSGDMTVPLVPSQWSSVFGARGDASAQVIGFFNDALRNCEHAGITFGGGSAFGHGVRVTSGSARYHMLEFRV